MTQRGKRAALSSIQGNWCLRRQFRARERCRNHALIGLRQTTGLTGGHDFARRCGEAAKFDEGTLPRRFAGLGRWRFNAVAPLVMRRGRTMLLVPLGQGRFGRTRLVCGWGSGVRKLLMRARLRLRREWNIFVRVIWPLRICFAVAWKSLCCGEDWRCLAPVGQGTLRGCGATLLACGKGASGGRAPDFGVLGWRRRAKFSRVQAGLLPGARGTADGVF